MIIVAPIKDTDIRICPLFDDNTPELILCIRMKRLSSLGCHNPAFLALVEKSKEQVVFTRVRRVSSLPAEVQPVSGKS
jgi:hypothetical protein